MGICGGCGSPQAAMRCAKCQGIMYCSVECQKKNWKLHKQLCRGAKPQPTDGSSNGDSNGAPPVVSFPATTNRRLDGRLYGASLQASAHVLQGLGVSSATALGEIAVAFEKLLAEGARADVQLDLRGQSRSQRPARLLVATMDSSPMVAVACSMRAERPLSLERNKAQPSYAHQQFLVCVASYAVSALQAMGARLDAHWLRS